MASANRGVAWERCLDLWHDRYRACNPSRAVVFRTPPPVRVLGRVTSEGRFSAAWAGKGPPDYLGVLPRGRMVAFDAKSSAGKRWDFALLERHQAQALEGVHVAGGLSFVALQLDGAGWVLPWSELGERWWAWCLNQTPTVRGSASVGRVDLEAWAWRMPSLGDWLSALPPR